MDEDFEHLLQHCGMVVTPSLHHAVPSKVFFQFYNYGWLVRWWAVACFEWIC